MSLFVLHRCLRSFPLGSYFSSSVKDNREVSRRTDSRSPRRDFVEEKLGSKYVIGRSLDFAVSFEESSPATPMFFILSPGVDPLKDVEKHGNARSFQLSGLHDCKRLFFSEIACLPSLQLPFLFLSSRQRSSASRAVLSKSSADAPAFPL